jgi:hypothetical protein
MNLDNLTEFILLEDYSPHNNGGNITIQKVLLDKIIYYNLINNTEALKQKVSIHNNIYYEKQNIDNIKKEVNRILEDDYNFISLIIPIHLIGGFIYKNNENSYDFSVINTGTGIKYHNIFSKVINGKSYNFTNGIILFRNIDINIMRDTLEYLLFISLNNEIMPLTTDDGIKIFYNTLFEKITNYENISFDETNDKIIFFETPIQTIGDCSLKSFIYVFILLDYYNLITYNDYLKTIVNSNTEEIHTIENNKRSIKNYWIFYYNLFLNYMNEKLPEIKLKIIDDKTIIINNYISFLYIIKEKNKDNYNFYKYYSELEDFKSYKQNKELIKNEIIIANKEISKNYLSSLNSTITEINYYKNIDSIEFIPNNNNHNNLIKLYNKMFEFTGIEYEKKIIDECIKIIDEILKTKIVNDNKDGNYYFILYKIYDIIFNLMYNIFYKTNNISFDIFKHIVLLFKKITDIQYKHINRHIFKIISLISCIILCQYSKYNITEKDNIIKDIKLNDIEKEKNTEIKNIYLANIFSNLKIHNDEYNYIVKEIYNDAIKYFEENTFNFYDFTNNISDNMINQFINDYDDISDILTLYKNNKNKKWENYSNDPIITRYSISDINKFNILIKKLVLYKMKERFKFRRNIFLDIFIIFINSNLYDNNVYDIDKFYNSGMYADSIIINDIINDIIIDYKTKHYKKLSDIYYLYECLNNNIISDYNTDYYIFLKFGYNNKIDYEGYYDNNMVNGNEIRTNFDNFLIFKQNIKDKLLNYIEYITNNILFRNDIIEQLNIISNLIILAFNLNCIKDDEKDKIYYILSSFDSIIIDNMYNIININLALYLLKNDNKYINNILSSINSNDLSLIIMYDIFEYCFNIITKNKYTNFDITSSSYELNNNKEKYIIKNVLNSLTKNNQKLEYKNHDDTYKNDDIMIYLNKNIGLDNKLINYISYYSYILHNLFSWTITNNIMCGQPKNNTINYGIIFDNDKNTYSKNILLLKNKKYDCNDSNILLLTKDKILEYSCNSENFKMCLNKLLGFLHVQQILFWNYEDKIEIEIPEYNISFYYNIASKTITFGNYIVYINFKYNNDTKLIFNLIGNTPNTFIMYNEQDKSYFILNISRFSHFDTIEDCKKNQSSDKKLNCIDDNQYNELFYYDILEVHYSNLFINFKDDITLINYINTIKSNSNNYLIINLLKTNQFTTNIFKDKDKDKRKQLIKTHLNIDKNNLYENHINKYIEGIYNQHVYSNSKTMLSTIFEYKDNFNIFYLIDNIQDNIIFKYYIDLIYLKDNIDIKYFIDVGINVSFLYDEKKFKNLLNSDPNVKEILNKNKNLNNYQEYQHPFMITSFIDHMYQIIKIINKKPYNIDQTCNTNQTCNIKYFYYNIKKDNKYYHLKELYDFTVNKINEYNNKRIQKQILYQMGGGLNFDINNIELEDYDENKDNKIVNKFIKILIYKDIDDIQDKSLDTIIITKNDLESLDYDDFYKYIRLVMEYYNTRIIELFYTQPKFTKICILLLLKRVYPDLTKIDKTVINTTLSLIYYQFIIGGLLRDNQIDIIHTILSNYSFDNNYTDIIKNTYTNNYTINGDLFNTNKLQDQSIREIHNLIMGAGKTKMITPIILIFLYEYIINFNTTNNILLILPSKLINQSYMFLKYSIEYFFNYKVSICSDLFDNLSNSKIKIISDIDIKSSLINKKIHDFNKDKYFVLLDEADMILNPLTSEMNYPDNEKNYLDEDNFNKLINILFNVLKYNNRDEIIKNLIDYIPKEYNNFSQFKEFVDFITENKSEYTEYNELINYKKEYKLDIIEYKFYDIIYNIINNVNTVVNNVNRKDFGFGKETDNIVIPFQFSETPILGSEYSDIIINLLLTIRAYIDDKKISFYKLVILFKYYINKLAKLKNGLVNKDEDYIFITNLFTKYEIGNILYLFNIDIKNIDTLKNTLIEYGLFDKITEIMKDLIIIIKYCKLFLHKNIYYYKKQETISGVNIVNSNYFKYLNGFTGTPEDRFKFIDPFEIKPKNDNSIKLELEAITNNCSVIEYIVNASDISKYSENYDYIDFILNNVTDKQYNVIIDVGALFINRDINIIASLIFDKFRYIDRFVFFDKDDKILTIHKNNIYTFSNFDTVFDNDMIFFDNSHTTGIDLQLNDNFNALITIRQNTRYRDFIQGLYRMRQINKTQTAEILIMPNILNEINLKKFKIEITKTEQLINFKINNDQFINMLNVNDDLYYADQEYYFNIQQLRMIKTISKDSNQEEKPFEINNNMITLTTKYEDFFDNKILKEMNNIYSNYVVANNDKIKEIIDNLSKNIITTNKLSIQKQEQQQVQVQEQEQLEIQNNIKKQLVEYTKYNDTYIQENNSDYFQIYDNYNKINFNYLSSKYKTVYNFRNIKFSIGNTILNYNKNNNRLFNDIMFIYIKNYNINNEDDTINTDIIKLDHYNKIINIVNYTLQTDISKEFIVFDLFGNIIINNKLVLEDKEKNIIKNIKFIFLLTDESILKNKYILTYNDLKNIYNKEYNLEPLISLLEVFYVDKNSFEWFSSYNCDYRFILLLILACANKITFINKNNIITNFINMYILNDTDSNYNFNLNDICNITIGDSEIKVCDLLNDSMHNTLKSIEFLETNSIEFRENDKEIFIYLIKIIKISGLTKIFESLNNETTKNINNAIKLSILNKNKLINTNIQFKNIMFFDKKIDSEYKNKYLKNINRDKILYYDKYVKYKQKYLALKLFL